MKFVLKIALVVILVCLLSSCTVEALANLLNGLTGNIVAGEISSDVSQLEIITGSVGSISSYISSDADGVYLSISGLIKVYMSDLENTQLSYTLYVGLNTLQQNILIEVLNNVRKTGTSELTEILSLEANSESAFVIKSTASLLSTLLKSYRLKNSETGSEEGYEDLNSALSLISEALAEIVDSDVILTTGDVLYVQALTTAIISIFKTDSSSSSSSSKTISLDDTDATAIFQENVMSTFAIFLMLSEVVDETNGTGIAIHYSLVNGALNLSDSLLSLFF